MQRRIWSAIIVLLMAGSSLSAQAARAGNSTNIDWELRGGNRDNQNFSALKDINEASAARLGLAWHADLPTADAPVGTPIVVNGVSYVTSTLNIVFANDVRTGKLLWVYDPAVRFSKNLHTQLWGVRITRGVGYLDGRVFVSTGDCRLIALDAGRGTKDWEQRVCPAGSDYTITSAPRTGGGMVFVGPNNEDLGTARAYVDAYEARTGKRLWRFYTVPGPAGSEQGADPGSQSMAAKTWDPQQLPRAAGGSVWDDVTYDEVTGLVYLSAGGTSPWNPTERGANRGDELFTNSIIALDAKTGRYVWHYQVTPRDGWNLEPVGPKVLADLQIDGRSRRVVMDAPKNGFFYVLDAKTGRLVNKPNAFVPVNWAKEIDFATGRPVLDPAAEYWGKPDGAVVYPSPSGAHSWLPMGFSPATGLVYIPALEHAAKIVQDPSGAGYGGDMRMDYLSGMKNARFPLVAWDPVQQQARWKTDGTKAFGGGVLVTAGNLVFQGGGDGFVRGLRADDGKELWSFDTGGVVLAPPVTVRLDGVQWLLVLSGPPGTSALVRAFPQFVDLRVVGPPRLLAFRLDAAAKLPSATPPLPFAKPELPRPSEALAKQGEVLFETKGCNMCHGARAHSISTSVPDLRRRAFPGSFSIYEDVVRKGALSERGMPHFGDALTPDEIKLIQAMVLREAWYAYEAQERGQ
jgi:quinohemoprotein ethanol dehydrogenase